MAGVWPKTLNVRQTDRQRKWLPISRHCQVHGTQCSILVTHKGSQVSGPSIKQKGKAHCITKPVLPLYQTKIQQQKEKFRSISMMIIDAKLTYIVNWILHEYIKITHQNQFCFNPEMIVWSNIHKSISVLYCIKRFKDKNSRTTMIDTRWFRW